jgi:stage II sporulation protein D
MQARDLGVLVRSPWTRARSPAPTRALFARHPIGPSPWIALLALLHAAPVVADPAPGARPEEPRAGRFLPFHPLSGKELYEKRMRFTEGEPIISVGIMEGQGEIRLGAEGPTRLMFEEAGLPKTVYAPPGRRFTFRPLAARPPRLRFWAVVETLPYADVEGARSVEARWVAEGHSARVFEVGTIVALRGNVLDTRERRVGVGGFATLAEAEALASRLFERRKLLASIHQELVEPPAGVIGVFDEQNRRLHRVDSALFFGTVEGGQLEVEDVEHSRGYANHGRERRRFWGHLYLTIDRHGRLSLVNSVGAEKLLQGLVPAEIFATAPLEALKSQAVTARGEIFSKLGHRHFGEPYHLCSEQHCQVYAGAGVERPAPTQAVLDTRGLLAFRPAQHADAPRVLVDSVYSSTCGGFSEANEVAWDQAPSESLRSRLDGAPGDPALLRFAGGLQDEANLRAWLSSVPPVECARSTFVRADKLRWTRTLSGKKLDDLVAGLGVGHVRELRVLGRGKGGRVTGVRVVGSAGKAEVLRELPVRRLFGNLNSGMFVIDEQRDPSGELLSVTFVGGGWGHGVGMCQVGAIGRAQRGQTFREILAHYYDGAVVDRIY